MTKKLWDQIDDNNKLVILGYSRSSSPSPFPRRSPSKPPFPLKHCCSINLHEMPTYDPLQVHTHELEPDPASGGAIDQTSSILKHDFKEDEQGGEVHELGSSFDKIGDYKHLINVQNLQYVQCPDDELNDDIIDPCVLDPQTSQGPHDPDNHKLYDAKDKENGLPPEDSLPVPNPSGPKTLTKCVTAGDNLRARMSGGETHINIDVLTDRSNIDKSKLAGTSDTAGTSIFGCESNFAGMSDTAGTDTTILGVYHELPQPPDGTLQDRYIDGTNTGMLTDETKPPPPPEPPPTFYKIHQKLNMNVMVCKDPPILNHSSKFKDKDIRRKFQSIVPYDYKGSQCNALIEWVNGETNNELLKVIDTETSVTYAIFGRENDLLEKPGLKHPRTYEQTLGLDKRNKNTLRGDTTTLELTQINDYDIFIGKGRYTKVKTPDRLKKAQDQITQYQAMLDALQWIVTIGHFNINTAVMTMSEFLISPRVEHVNSSKCTYRYLLVKHASIRIMPEEFDLSDFPDNVHDWTYSVYGKVEKLLYIGAPKPLGNHVILSHDVDARLRHDIAMRRSAKGIMHLNNMIPMEWYPKKQATMETAKYGSKFVADRICVEQVIELHNILRFLGMLIKEKSYMFGDNKFVADSFMQLNAKLHMYHFMLSFHHVRETIAGETLDDNFLPGDGNPAIILSIHWEFIQKKGRQKSMLIEELYENGSIY